MPSSLLLALVVKQISKPKGILIVSLANSGKI